MEAKRALEELLEAAKAQSTAIHSDVAAVSGWALVAMRFLGRGRHYAAASQAVSKAMCSDLDRFGSVEAFSRSVSKR